MNICTHHSPLTSYPPPRTSQFKPQDSRLRQLFPKMNLSGGPTLSDLGFDLLSRLLALNPERRISMREALEHPWFSEPPHPTPRNLMPAYALGQQAR